MSFNLNNFDCFLFDCDGVLWRGNKLIEGASDVIKRLRSEGKTVIFVTNNSSNSRSQYVNKLRERMNISVEKESIYCSSFAAAAYLQDEKFTGTAYVIGHEGVGIELREAGIKTIEAREVISCVPSPSDSHPKYFPPFVSGPQ